MPYNLSLNECFHFKEKFRLPYPYSGVAVEVEIVFTRISREVQIVVLIDLMTDIQIHIIKRSLTSLYCWGKVQHPICIGGSSGQNKRCLIFY